MTGLCASFCTLHQAVTNIVFTQTRVASQTKLFMNIQTAAWTIDTNDSFVECASGGVETHHMSTKPVWWRKAQATINVKTFLLFDEWSMAFTLKHFLTPKKSTFAWFIYIDQIFSALEHKKSAGKIHCK